MPRTKHLFISELSRRSMGKTAQRLNLPQRKCALHGVHSPQVCGLEVKSFFQKHPSLIPELHVKVIEITLKILN